MLIAPYPTNESARLALLHRLNILDTESEETIDRFTRVLAQLAQVPMALVSLVDADRQWFKSRLGISVCETARDIAFCAHALHEDDVFVVEDARSDVRFHDNPLVLGEPFIRFYAGVALRSVDGLAVGTLCALDTRPRTLDASTLSAMKDLAHAVERELFQRSVVNDARQVYHDERRARNLSESRFATIFRETPTGKAIVALDGRFETLNPRFCQITGYNADELLGRHFASITHPEDLAQDMELVQELVEGRRTSYSIEKRYIRKDGSVVWVELNVAILRDEMGVALSFISAILDITGRKSAQALLIDYQIELERRVAERTVELDRSRQTLQTIADSIPLLIAQIDSRLRYVFNNARYREVFGVDPENLRGKAVQSVLSPEVFERLLPYFERALNGERATCDDVRYVADDARIWRATYIPDVRDAEVVGFFVMSQDVTEQKRKEQALIDRALLDPLTGLPNRALLMDKLCEGVRSAGATGSPLSVFFLDLDGFKHVNDEHGHDIGDELLCQVAERLRHRVRQHDLICRLGGDEFVVISYGVNDVGTCERIAKALCSSLKKPFRLRGLTIHIGVSIGIALHPGCAATSAEALLTLADAAMYEAKRGGRNRYHFAAHG